MGGNYKRYRSPSIMQSKDSYRGISCEVPRLAHNLLVLNLRKSVHQISSCNTLSNIDEIKEDKVRISMPAKRGTTICIRHDSEIELA